MPGPEPSQSDPPLLSFAILAYNQEGLVADAIAGALEQTYSPLEIVISDDASADGTFAAIEAAVAGYDGPHRIVLNRNSDNLGIAAHVDRVMSLTRGEFVVVNAGDDRSLPDRAAAVAEVWRASGGAAHAIHSACIQLDAAGGPSATARPPEVMRGDPRPLDIAEHYHHCIGAGLSWSRVVFDAFGPISEHALVEDHVIPFRAAILGRIAYIDRALVVKKPGGVANLALPETGYDRLYGLRLRLLPWIVTDYRQFEADLSSVDFDGKPQVAAAIARRRAYHEFEWEIARARWPERLLRVAEALRKARRHRDRRFARKGLLYAGGPLAIWYLDLRRALRRRGAAPSE